ncbi:MAG: DUF3276 family protein, partial [Bacteroidota bacterium]
RSFAPSPTVPLMDDRRRRFEDEVFSKRVRAGKRSYFFDVKPTRSGQDFFLTITESRRMADSDRYQKSTIRLYKEDFGKFILGLHEAIENVREEQLPAYDFSDVPLLDPDTIPEENDEDWD